jgi:glycosyltransferase involved in cell wall biosynthesis
MGACWRALAARPGVEVKVIAFAPRASATAPFAADAVLRGVDHSLLDATQRDDAGRIASLVADHRPDAVVIAGWAHRPYVRLLREPRLASARFAMAMDTPWTGSWRQRLGWARLAPIASRLHGVLVAGERAYLLARQLRIPEAKIRRGSYGYDDALFAGAFERRRELGAHPRRFLFTGSYDRRKGLDLILGAYRRYRAEVADPWPLTCCGRGELAGEVAATGGVEDRGFVQPGW